MENFVANPKLRGWLGEHNMSQVQFAKNIEMPLNTFRYKINGFSDWTLSDINKILKFTHKSFDELF